MAKTETSPNFTAEYIRKLGAVAGGGELFWVMQDGKRIAQCVWRKEELIPLGVRLTEGQTQGAVLAIDAEIARRAQSRQ